MNQIFNNTSNEFESFYFHGFNRPFDQIENFSFEYFIKTFSEDRANDQDFEVAIINKENIHKISNYYKDYLVQILSCLYCKKFFSELKALIFHFLTFHLEYHVGFCNYMNEEIYEIHIFSFCKENLNSKTSTYKKIKENPLNDNIYFGGHKNNRRFRLNLALSYLKQSFLKLNK